MAELVNDNTEPIVKIYKTPEYVAKANKNYYDRKKNDPEYIKQKLEKQQQRKSEKKLQSSIEENNVQDKRETIKECPEYIKRAARNYYERNKSNPEFVKKLYESQKKYREANRDRLREADRIRYQNKKLEKQKQLNPPAPVESVESVATINNDLPEIQSLSIE
jgi:hypothetical protein